MKPEELKTILTEHALWLSGNGGKLADLSGANLRGACLRCANLRGAYLSGAYLGVANLSGADLSGAYLSGANLSGANLRGANLRGANLSDANLIGANLSDANLSDASGVKVAACSWSSHGARGRQLSAVLLPDGLRFYCGCFNGSEQELRRYISVDHSKYRASRTKALDFLLSCF